MTYFIPMLLGASSGFLFGWAKPVPVNTTHGDSQWWLQCGNAGKFGGNRSIISFLATLCFRSFSSLSTQPSEADTIAYLFGSISVLIMKLLLVNVVLAVSQSPPYSGI
jgi:hypothetical protein